MTYEPHFIEAFTHVLTKFFKNAVEGSTLETEKCKNRDLKKLIFELRADDESSKKGVQMLLANDIWQQYVKYEMTKLKMWRSKIFVGNADRKPGGTLKVTKQTPFIIGVFRRLIRSQNILQIQGSNYSPAKTLYVEGLKIVTQRSSSKIKEQEHQPNLRPLPPPQVVLDELVPPPVHQQQTPETNQSSNSTKRKRFSPPSKKDAITNGAIKLRMWRSPSRN